MYSREKCYNWHRYAATRPPTCGCRACNEKWETTLNDLADNEGYDEFGGLPVTPEIPAPPKFKFDAKTRPPPVSPDMYVRQALPKYGVWVMIDSDIHFPIQDRYVEAVKLSIARDTGLWGHVNAGDTYDLWSLSTYEKEAGKIFEPGARLQEEFDAGQPYWQEMDHIVHPDGFMHYLLGNHEDRATRFLSVNMSLFGLRALDFGKMAELPSRVVVHNNNTRLNVGPVTVEHGNRLAGDKKTPANPIDYALKKPMRSTVFGHTHKFGYSEKTEYTPDGEPIDTFALNLGHGQDVAKQSFHLEPNWQHGFAMIRFETVAGQLEATPFPIRVRNGVANFMGKIYNGRKLI